ncbi:MAG: hypothetical protein JSW28_00320 [Thermoplasmata archaeon]|nr:MAG: hypothetical protein JSW28_00320 [Thermoplasmata archaeon]
MADKIRVTVKEKILLHLLYYSKYREEFEVPAQITQEGMAEAIGVRRSHIASALKDLKGAEFVEESKARIKGHERRKNAYFLTHEGQAEAFSLKEGILDKKITLKKEDGSLEEIPIADVNKHLGQTISILEILKRISEDGIFDAKGEEEEPERPEPPVIANVLVCPFCRQANMNLELKRIQLNDGNFAFSASCLYCRNGFLAEELPVHEGGERSFRPIFVPPEIIPALPRFPGGDAMAVSLGLFFMLASFAVFLAAVFNFVPGQACFLMPFGLLISLVLLYQGLRNVTLLSEIARRIVIITGAAFAGFIALIFGLVFGADYDAEQAVTMALVVFPAFAVFIFAKPLSRDLRSELSLSLGIFLILFGAFLTAFHELLSWSAVFSPFWVIAGAVMIFTSYEIEKLERVYIIRGLCAGSGAFAAVFCALVLASGFDSLGLFKILGISLWLCVGILLVYTRFMEEGTCEDVFDALKSAFIAGLGTLFALAGVVLAVNGRLMVSVVEFFIGLPIIWYGLGNAKDYSSMQLAIIAFVLVSEVAAALSFILA